MDKLREDISAFIGGRVENSPWTDASFALLELSAERDRPVDRIEYYSAANFAKEYIRAGKPLPEKLGEFVIDVLSGDMKPPPGPKWGHNVNRDAVIWKAVCMAVEGGMLPFRNDTSDPESACDMVCECLKESGIHLSYKAVAKIYSALNEAG